MYLFQQLLMSLSFTTTTTNIISNIHPVMRPNEHWKPYWEWELRPSVIIVSIRIMYSHKFQSFHYLNHAWSSTTCLYNVLLDLTLGSMSLMDTYSVLALNSHSCSQEPCDNKSFLPFSVKRCDCTATLSGDLVKLLFYYRIKYLYIIIIITWLLV